MALSPLITALLFALALSASFELSTCHEVLKGKVSCSDCSNDYDLSGVKVLVKCNHLKKLAMATTQVSGSFKVNLPSDAAMKTPSPLHCHAKLFGGPVQLYASKKNMVSKVMKPKNSNSYKISTPLAFSISCPSNVKDSKCGAANKFGSSKTVDLPLPPEWGLAPSSYYVPFVPIIGIP
ncbi:hypothetical protein CISIN_1g030378mg [Citrus sinensis]|uniref:Pollen Ole e 1 allergen and extensin family protein n=1 Tax=Citrus sinensis TaxID=2711 RepID=A0A067DA28_CITSI|nr:hypothetical protein CISIN_1g030378mg [Citrus sinensis]